MRMLIVLIELYSYVPVAFAVYQGVLASTNDFLTL